MEHIKSALLRVKQDIDMDSILLDTSLIDEVGLDSLEMIQFILQLENEYEIEIDFDELDLELFTNVKMLDDFCTNQKILLTEKDA